MIKWKRYGWSAAMMLMLLAAAGCAQTNYEYNPDNPSEQMKYKITGVEPGAGVVQATEKAVRTYDNLKGWKVKTSSSGAMAIELGEAYRRKQPIVVTGWTPHWKFAKYDLKYLEDPKNVFGKSEEIKTMVRKGLKTEKPEAYQVLDRFHWTVKDMETVMYDIQNGKSPEEAAEKWLKAHPDKADEWTKGIAAVRGDSIKLAYVEWDSEIASTHVIGRVLEKLGYKVKLTSLDNAIMWQSVATGDSDGMVCAWLPATHGDLYKQYKNKLEDLGVNLKGAKVGLVVPAYMKNVNSIEDLQPKTK